MAAPKRKTSKSKLRMRRAQDKLPVPKLSPCPECGEAKPSHVVCPSCGKYNGRQVIQVKSKS